MTDAEVLFERGQETALRLRRQAAERREQGISEPAPVHCRRRFAKGAETKRFTARTSLEVYVLLCEECRKSGRELPVVLDELLRQAAGLPLP